MVTVLISARGRAYFKDCPVESNVSDIIDTMFDLVEELPPTDRDVMTPLLKTWCEQFHTHEWDCDLEQKAVTKVFCSMFGDRFIYSIDLIRSVD